MNLENYLLSLIKSHYRVIVICFLSMSVICGSMINFRIEHSIESWVDKNSDSYHQYQRFTSEFGDDATLLAVYERTDLTPTNLQEYLSFIEHISSSAGVSIVFDPVNMFLLNLDGDSLDKGVIDDLKKSFAQKLSDFRNVLMSPDMKTLGIFIILKQDLEYLHPQIVHEVKQELTNIGLHPYFAGTSYFSDTLSASLTHDLTVVISGLIIMSLLVMLWFLRSPVVVVCVITGIGISLLYTLAFTSLMDIKFNLLSLIMYPLIFCIGITSSTHLFSRRNRGKWDMESAYKKIFKPTIITMITTIIGCSAFIFAPQTVVRDMGLVFPFAIGVTYFVMMIFVPSAYRLLANNRELPPLAISSRVNFSPRRNFIVSLLLFGVTVVSIFQLPKLRTEPDAIYFFAPDSELIQSYKLIEDQLTGLLVVDMIVATNNGTLITEKNNTLQIKQFINSVRKLPELTTIISPMDWINTPVEDVLIPEMKQAYMGNDRQSMRITFRFKSISGKPYFSNINNLQRLWNKSSHPGLSMYITGLLPMILDAQDALLKTQAVVFPAILILMTLVLASIIRSPKVLLAACLANLLPLVVVAGVMGMFDIPVNSINLFVVSVMLGVIVDDTIHFLHAWKNTGLMKNTMHEVKPALWITTLTIVLAFTSLLFSDLRPVFQFGLLSVIAVSIAYLCDVFMLPFLLEKSRVTI
jgi:uncharacterized protein